MWDEFSNSALGRLLLFTGVIIAGGMLYAIPEIPVGVAIVLGLSAAIWISVKLILMARSDKQLGTLIVAIAIAPFGLLAAGTLVYLMWEVAPAVVRWYSSGTSDRNGVVIICSSWDRTWQ